MVLRANAGHLSIFGNKLKFNKKMFFVSFFCFFDCLDTRDYLDFFILLLLMQHL